MADRAGEVVVCLMARAPERGRVKRRLAATTGEAAAAAAYTTLLEHKMRILAGLRLPLEMWMTGDVQACQRVAAKYEVVLRLQPAGDLGLRMLHIVRCAHREGRVALVTGVDLPEIGAAYLENAADALSRHDLVLAPTEDGGYGLIGMGRPQPVLFEDMPWGGEQVCALTRERSAALGLRVAELPITWDVDDERDWRRFRRLFGQRPVSG